MAKKIFSKKESITFANVKNNIRQRKYNYVIT